LRLGGWKAGKLGFVAYFGLFGFVEFIAFLPRRCELIAPRLNGLKNSTGQAWLIADSIKMQGEKESYIYFNNHLDMK
jgi:hypothetical protein